MQTLLASVGYQGENKASDVKLVQQLLNQHPSAADAPLLDVDGLIGSKTINRIKDFQKTIVNMANPDGRVDPNGKTFNALAGANASSITTNTSTNDYQLSTDGMDLLKSIEELRLTTYDDQTGKDITSWVEGATIGYGHLISHGEWDTYKDGINQTEAEALFIKDLSPYVNAVNSKVTSVISQNQFDALVILTFNIGIGGFESSSVLKLVNNPATNTAYPNLEAAWMAWNKSQGKVMQGLTNRRKAEWDIYSENVYKRW